MPVTDESEDCTRGFDTNETSEVYCKHCEESGLHFNKSGHIVYWDIKLDQDLWQTIVSIYPEWFREYIDRMDGGDAEATDEDVLPSPPHCIIDDSPIQDQIDKYKESLRVKLMLRRPMAQLVDQGILPPPKTPAAFFEQRQKLERAKMGDILKAKIQRRPGKQELIQQHILEDNGNVDPSLAERQRQLKKAKLADILNDQLSHRPGPLELIEDNILHTDLEFEKAIKEGQIAFKKTSEGEAKKNPTRTFSADLFEEDSISDGVSSPSQNDTTPSLPSPASTGYHLSTAVGPGAAPSFSPSLASSSSSLSPLSSVPSPSASFGSGFSSSSSSSMTPATATAGTGKSRKKLKAKSQPKMRTIKFHEYKGPPSMQKKETQPPMSQETSYDLLLKQQQLFLQWQLELQHKYPQIILPANKSGADTNVPNVVAISPPLLHRAVTAAQQQQQQDGAQPSPSPRVLPKLEGMKGKAEPGPVGTPPGYFAGWCPPVMDLKAELKRRNLPVSGCKPQLIERLKPYSDPPHGSQVALRPEMPVASARTFPAEELNVPPPSAVVPMDLDIDSEAVVDTAEGSPCPCVFTVDAQADPEAARSGGGGSDDAIRQQELRIAQLLRELQESKRQLEQLKKWNQNSGKEGTSDGGGGGGSGARSQQKLILHQHLQKKIQTQQLQAHIQRLKVLQDIQQQQHERTAAVVAAAAVSDHSKDDSEPATLARQLKSNGHSIRTTTSLPLAVHLPADPLWDRPPLSYETALEHLKMSSRGPQRKAIIKSQAVDDVLEILIRNGELPPSAAADPQVPPVTIPKMLELSSNQSVLPSSVPHGDSPPGFVAHSSGSASSGGAKELKPPPPPVKVENEALFVESLDFPFVDYDRTMETDLISCFPGEARDPLLLNCQEPLDLFSLEDIEFRFEDDSARWT